MPTEHQPRAPHPRSQSSQRTTGASRQRALEQLGALRTTLTGRVVSPYAAAALRIGYGFLYLVFLLREFPHRDEIWGPGSPWTPALAAELFSQTGWSSILTLSDSRPYFEACYALALVASALYMLGWRTRVLSVIFAVVVASFHSRAIFMTDGGDNLILLMAVYLCFTACGRRWSLDARRVRIRVSADQAGQPSTNRRTSNSLSQLSSARQHLTTVMHNCAMLVIAAQVCLLYGSAGLYKVQGSYWDNGTALHYVLNLGLFRPWPALSLMVDRHQMLVVIASYLTVLLQVALPFVLFSRAKYVVLTMLLGMHLGIAVLMGLPLFSGAMVIADAVFLPDRFYAFLGRAWRSTSPTAACREAGPAPPQTPLVPNQPESPDRSRTEAGSEAHRRPANGPGSPP
ncbi:HTTM domain-containing protein [Streptomyces sp. H27-D2]|uniref:HTTM domain-containing protein n=1 Tax=Streptomyces sp. H27-D2 TaxID=3046304 RepID=UPI002DBFB01E|nr:HTTM domain-containing protein [Streptomyces sp. H27-D2]MEC4017441.1 HTTM domain-containing protein [Streptomyces sp. H27-D2]